MIKIKKNIKKLVSILKIISNLNLETDFTFKLDGIFIRAVHPSKHCLVIFELNKSLFEEYSVEKEMTYTLQTDKFEKIVRKIGKELELNAIDDGLVMKNNKSEFTLNYFVGKKDDKLLPEVTPTSIWKITSSELFGIISDLIEFSEIGRLGGTENLFIKTKSNMIKGSINVESEKVESIGEEVYYDITYFDMIKDIKDIFKDIRMGYGKDLPCVIKANDDDINFMWMLAARAEDEE